MAFFGGVLAGCASEERRKLDEMRKEFATEVVGRWTGSAVEPPEEVWFTHAKFDISFSDRGDFSVVASTYAKKPYDVHFLGSYEVLTEDVLHERQRPLSVVAHPLIRIDERDLGGLWFVEQREPGRMVISRGDMRLDLRKRYGS